MSISEFDLIAQYFSNRVNRDDLLLGIGDDAALIQVPEGKALAVAVDTLVEGVHFFKDAPPDSIGHKVLAVNLSDMAAMGAEPAWFTLAITLPEIDDKWLQLFSDGMFKLAAQHNLSIVGGDTTRGPLCVSVQVSGYCKKALRRDSAKPGHLIMVSGTLGDAAAAVAAINNNQQPDNAFLQKLQFPEPRCDLGVALVDYAESAIDVSDGLVSDLGHILTASQCGASIHLDKLPLSKELIAIDSPEQWDYVLAGGDDYELCFTIDPASEKQVIELAKKMDVRLTTIGVIEEAPDLRILRGDGSEFDFNNKGYDHFG